MAFGLLLLILLILLFTLLLASLVLMLSRWTTYRRVEQVSCSRCGYSVAFSPARHCSECGVDLSETGVLTPEMGRAFIPNRRAIASALMLTLFCGVAGIIGGASLLHYRYFGTILSYQLIWDQPGSQSYRFARLTYGGCERQGQIVYHDVCLDVVFADGTESAALCFTPSSPIHEVDAIDPAKRQGEFAPRSILKASDVPFGELETWAASIGLNVEDAQIQGELQDIRRVLTHSIRTRDIASTELNFHAGSFTGAISDAPAYEWLLVIAGLAVIALTATIGGWYLPYQRRRYRRPLRDAADKWLEETGVKAAPQQG